MRIPATYPVHTYLAQCCMPRRQVNNGAHNGGVVCVYTGAVWGPLLARGAHVKCHTLYIHSIAIASRMYMYERVYAQVRVVSGLCL